MITIVTGAPGHGKSYRAIKVIAEAVAKGIPVATNVPLREDWPVVLAEYRTAFARFRPERVAQLAAEYEGLVHYTEDLDELLRVRIAGTGEGRGRLVLDEAHRWMNTRAWDQSPGLKRDEAISKRLEVVGHVSAHRHYGLDVWLITQDIKNLDSQVRSLYEFHSESRNLRRLPVVGALLRLNLFLCITRWNDDAKSKAGLEVYGLNKSIARLYSTHHLEAADWPVDAIVLPRPKLGPVGRPPMDRESEGAQAPARSEHADDRPSLAPEPQPDVGQAAEVAAGAEAEPRP